MKGIKELMKLRLEGLRPELTDVWVGEDDKPFYEWYKYSETRPYPRIVIEPSDNLGLIEYRFAVGLDILLRGDDTDRLLNVYSQIRQSLS